MRPVEKALLGAILALGVLGMGPASFAAAETPEIGLDAAGAPWHGPSPYAEVTGTIDGHNHVTAYEFLGGDAHCGEPWNPGGPAVALVDCPDHYPDGSAAVLENALYGDPLRKHDPIGWPTFKDWPAPASQTHEQTYYRWIERAYLGGVRIMVNDLVENVALCQVYPLKHNSCDDMDSIRLQYRRIHELEEFIDAKSGGPGQGWFRIVRDPFEARRVINEGKMAVVLGIETSEIFGCGGSEQLPRCNREQILAGLDEIERMGVASFFPIHKFDNALGGVRFDSGTFGAAINAANFKQTGHFWEVERCKGPETDNEQATVVPEDIIDAGLLSFFPAGLTPLYPPASPLQRARPDPAGRIHGRADDRPRPDDRGRPHERQVRLAGAGPGRSARLLGRPLLALVDGPAPALARLRPRRLHRADHHQPRELHRGMAAAAGRRRPPLPLRDRLRRRRQRLPLAAAGPGRRQARPGHLPLQITGRAGHLRPPGLRPTRL